MSKRIVIVGAGPGGLAAAMLLAKAGADVTVVERLDRVGGRSGTIKADGFSFDMGATFFLYPRVLEDVFAACGRRLQDEVDLIRLDPQYHLIFENSGALRATGDVERMEREIAQIAPGDATGFRRFMTDNRQKLERFRPALETNYSGLRDVLTLELMKLLPLLRPHASVDDDLKRYFADPRIRLAFSFQSKYLGMSPFQCPSLFTILGFMEYEYGVFHPRGGCGALLARMAEVAAELGAKIRLNEPVEEILFSGRRAVGVRTPTGEIRADALVINADFANTMTKLVPNALRRRWRNEKIERKRFSCSTFMMYLGIEGQVGHLDHHTIFLAEDYRKNLAEIVAGSSGPPDNPSLYVQNACVTDPDLAPPGCSTLYVLVPVAHRTGAFGWTPEEQRRYRARVLKQLEKIGVEDIERRIRYERIMTPAAWESEMQIYRGATFNLAHSLGQMLHWRPRNRFEDLDGVYLVGGGTHPGSGLPVIFESARISSRLVAEDLGLAPRWSVQSAMAPEFRTAMAG